MQVVVTHLVFKYMGLTWKICPVWFFYPLSILNVFYSLFSFLPLHISQVVSTVKSLTILCFMVQQLSLLMTVFRVNLLNLLCQGICNIINRNFMCKPLMHQMKLNQFSPGWLPLLIVFHHWVCKINGFGGNGIQYYFWETLYLKVTGAWH